MRDTMWWSAWGFSKPSLIWLLPARDVTCGICNCPGTISRAYICSPNVVGDGVAEVMSVWGFTTAGTFNSVLPCCKSLTKVVGRVPSSWLRQFVMSQLLPLNALHIALYSFEDCAHHPARFLIFPQLAKLCIFFISISVFPIMYIIGTWKIPQTVSDSIQYFLKGFFRLCGCRLCPFNISHIFLLLYNHCLCVLNSLACHCSRTMYIILNPFLLLLVA